MPNVIETTDAAGNISTTYALGLEQTARGQLASGSDHDWFAVTLSAGQTYRLAMTGTGANNVADPYLRLYNGNGVTLAAQNDDGLQGGNSLIVFTATQSGTYYLDAGSYNNSGSGQYGLSVTAGAKALLDSDMAAGVIDGDASWSGAPATVTYGFRSTAAPYTVDGSNIATFSRLTLPQVTAVTSILPMFSEVAGITFTRVNPGGYTNSAAMLFATYNDPSDGAGAFAFFPGSTADAAQAGDVWLNRVAVSTTSLPMGSYSHATIIHEIGHAVGLSHPGLYNAAPGVDITYAADAQFAEDTNQYSVMSYFDESNTGAGDYNIEPDTLMLYDILALQRVYGANTATRAGNTVYGFGGTAGAVYDFAVNTTPALCIWDGGGVDTLNASGFAQNQTINLGEGTFSSIGGVASNISIAFGAVIENAVGGAGSDTITGNAAANTLSGGAGSDAFISGLGGSDTIYGGAGDDLIDGGAGDETWLGGDAGADYIFGGGGNDRIDGGADNENWLGGDAGADYVTGGTGNDRIDGGADNEAWLGGDAGIDYITGGPGNDRMDGGADKDALSGDAGADYITGGAGDDRVDGGADGDSWLGGDAGIDYITGGAGNDRIDGGADNDTIYSEDGADTVTGGTGNDWIDAGSGNDVIYGNAGLDSFDFNAGSGADTVYDFTNDQDTLRIDPAHGFATTAAVVAATTASGSSALVNLGGGNTILLVSYLAANTVASLSDDIVIG